MDPMKKFMFEIKLKAFVILIINHHTKVLLVFYPLLILIFHH